ncbi:hypothetical protein DM860_008198 [Cuscuta australis]|uniref:Uncharacterized protein n=1 Tax=Cuscuta australis TaxID=267555 RepID=A0A328D6H4_9ASTE|nr:hypothetical protein DM860_008198 [Cuscuta australis]
MEKSSWYHAAPLLNLVEMLAGDFPGVRFSFFSTPQSNTCLFKPDADGELNIKAYDMWDEAVKGVALLPGREAAMTFVAAMPANYKRAVEEVMVAVAWRAICAPISTAVEENGYFGDRKLLVQLPKKYNSASQSIDVIKPQPTKGNNPAPQFVDVIKVPTEIPNTYNRGCNAFNRCRHER